MSHALLALGIIGTITPWIVHWQDGFFIRPVSMQQMVVYAYFAAIAASLIAFIAPMFILPRRKERDMHLALAMSLGATGLMSAFMVLLFSMM